MSQKNTHPIGGDNAVRIIPGLVGILQLAQLRKTSEIREGGHNGEILTQEYVLDHEVYGKAISIGAVLILRNVSVFFPKSSDHYLNITLKNIVKIFHKDTSAVNSCSGASTSRESYWAVEI
ncbi:GPCR kinase [Tanacetum coccineum]